MKDEFDKNIDLQDAGYVAQAKNTIDGVKSQMHTANPAELARLGQIVSSLQTHNLPSEMLTSLENLQTEITKREERAEQDLSTRTQEADKSGSAEWEKHVESLEKEAKRLEQEKIKQEIKRLETQHEDFKLIIDQRIEEETAKRKELYDYLSNPNLKGKDLDESKLRSYLRTPAQIEQDKQLYRQQREAQNIYENLSISDQKLHKEQEDLKELVAKEKQKSKQQQVSSLIKVAQKQIDAKRKEIKELKPSLEKAEQVKDEANKGIEDLEKVRGGGFLSELVKDKNTDTTIYENLNVLIALLKDEDHAVKNDEPIKNQEQREAFINGFNLAQINEISKIDISDQVDINKTPTEANNVEQDKLPQERQDLKSIVANKFDSMKKSLSVPLKPETSDVKPINTNNLVKNHKGYGR